MLVLTRKTLESVVVGDGVERTLKVTVLDIRGGKVKLGFEAARGLSVHRGEVWQRIRDNAARDRAPDNAAAPVLP